MLKKFKGSIEDIVIVLCLLAYLYFYRRLNLDFGIILGTTLVLFAVSLWLIARYQLGDNFSILPQSQKIISTGIYSKIRHPIYIASITATLGLCLAYRTIWLWAVLVVLVVLQIFRMRAEEKLLTQNFGEKYLQYKNSTWF